LTFALSGLWHGASWTFVLWGALHGMYMVFGQLSAKLREQLSGAFERIVPRPVLEAARTVITFSLVSFAWIFFRANSIQDAAYVVSHLFSATTGLSSMGAGQQLILGGLASDFWLVAGSLLSFLALQLADRRWDIPRLLGRQHAGLRFLAYATALLLMMNLGVTEEIPFIYFQF
jgi:hypothetical protein